MDDPEYEPEHPEERYSQTPMSSSPSTATRNRAPTSRRVAVLLPGIMGSTLRLRGNGIEIWSEDFGENYRLLLRNPSMLVWSDRVGPADADLLKVVRGTLPWPRFRLWKKTIDAIHSHNDFHEPDSVLLMGYDWRQSLLDSASELARRLNERRSGVHAQRGDAKPIERFVFVTHSMGGFLVRIAFAEGLIDKSVIDRIIHIGSPLLGAPTVFVSAYQDGRLPWIEPLSDALHRKKNRHRFFDLLLESMRTFPSVYQLMPPTDYKYIGYTRSHHHNPLDGDPPSLINEPMRDHAKAAHDLLAKAEMHLRSSNVPVFSIYTEVHKRPTEVHFVVRSQENPVPRYLIEEIDSTDVGDGTVPSYSAAGCDSCEKRAVGNVSHAVMCNATKIVDLVASVLG